MDFLTSFFQNIKDKISNPFFGTLTFILVFHHWTFWYALFNFDSGHNMAYKIAYLQRLASIELSYFNIFCIDIPIALAVTIVGYFIVVGTRSLSVWIEGRVWPWITGKLISNSVVLKEDHKKIIIERDEYFEQYEKERVRVREFSKNVDTQTSQIQEKDNVQLELNEQITDLQKTTVDLQGKIAQKDLELAAAVTGFQGETKRLTVLSRDYDELRDDFENRKKYTAKFRDIFLNDRNKVFFTKSRGFPPTVIDKVQELENTGMFQAYMSVGKYVEIGGSTDADLLKKFTEMDLLFKDSKGFERFTPIGEIIYNYSYVWGY